MEILGNDYESQDIIYILFSIFSYCQKSIRAFMKESHLSNTFHNINHHEIISTIPALGYIAKEYA
jgi:hypothetical protein